MSLLGIPLVLWGVVCLIVAGIWVFVWPGDARRRGRRPRHTHPPLNSRAPLALPGTAAFIAGFDILGGANTARFVALLALITYLVLMATLVVTK